MYAASALAASNAQRAQQLLDASKAEHPEPLAVSGVYAASLKTQVGSKCLCACACVCVAGRAGGRGSGRSGLELGRRLGW